jgi:hypothetical protein
MVAMRVLRRLFSGRPTLPSRPNCPPCGRAWPQTSSRALAWRSPCTRRSPRPWTDQSSYIESSIPHGLTSEYRLVKRVASNCSPSLRQQPVYDITVSPPLSLPSSASTTTPASSNLSESPLRFFNNSQSCFSQNPDVDPDRTVGGTSGLREEEHPATASYLAGWLHTPDRQAE